MVKREYYAVARIGGFANREIAKCIFLAKVFVFGFAKTSLTDHGTAVGVRGRRDGFVRSQRGAREAHARGGAPPRAGARWPAEDAATRIAAPGVKAGATGIRF